MAAPAAPVDAASSGHQFSSIFIGQRSGLGQGQLRMAPTGFLWRRNGGGQPIQIKQQDISSLHWTRVQRGFQLGVRVNDGATTNFIGFKEKDLEVFQAYCKQQYGKEVKELSLSTTGRNWGNVELNGRSLVFLVDGKLGFEVPLPDVTQAQQQKDDLMLEFQVDDLTSGEREDQLTELALHVPPGLNKKAKPQGAEEGAEGAANGGMEANPPDPPAKKLLDSLVQFTDTGATSADTAVASFSTLHVLAPRGRFDVEMSLGSMQMIGQGQDFKIRYQAIQRIFILPKSNTPHTLVVVSLDPPIRKGQTYYTHILGQFVSAEELELKLDITPEALAAKNEKTGGKLDMEMAGPAHEVFSRTLRGLSGAKITRPGSFKNATGDGYAVRCSYKADDGYLYPLDRAFFYVHKPPMLLPFEDVESVELTRLGGNTVSSKTFDLVVRTKMDTEHQFRGIQRREWQVLLDFFQAKKLRVERLRETQAQQAQGARTGINFDDDDGLPDDDEDEDEDFDAEKDSGSAPGSSENDSEDDASGDAEMVEEEGISVKAVLGKKSKDKGEGKEKKDKPAKEKKDKPTKAKKKRPASDDEHGEPEGSGGGGASKKKSKASKEPKDDGKPEKKKRAKKDPNAPKNALSAFMYFSNATRDKIKAENPGIAFGEVGRVLGEKWKAASADDKAPFEEMARKDKERYQKEMAAFKARGGGAKVGDGDDDDGGADE